MTSGPDPRRTPAPLGVSGRSRRLATLVVGVVVVVLVVAAAVWWTLGSGPESQRSAAAGGSTTSTAPPSPSASPSASSSTSAGTQRTQRRARPPAVPAPVRGPAGQRAFARHVMATWTYALRTNDPQPLVSLSPPSGTCRGCADLADTLAKRKRQGWYVAMPALKVRRVVVRPVDDNVYADATVDIAKSESFGTDGRFRNTNDAHRGASFQMLLHRGAKRFQLLAFTVR